MCTTIVRPRHRGPLYGKDLREAVGVRGVVTQTRRWQQHRHVTYGVDGRRTHCYFEYTNALAAAVQTHRTRLRAWAEKLRRFTVVVPVS